jgi:eukaryotic-like serine/threonine-protein kinase
MIKTLGRYQLLERIGEGAMADVFRAYDPSIDRHLAIKILKQDYRQDSEYTNWFLREAKSAGALSHPNIVTIYDAGLVDDQSFIVMELLDGKPLDELIDEGRVFSAEEVTRMGLQLADALSYAHGQGVIHRDIKPSNIMLLHGTNTIKLMDFGIARRGTTDPGASRSFVSDFNASRHSTVVGTPRYMSPEQAQGLSIDGRSDLFAVGAVLYELATREKAFTSGSMATLINQIIEEDPRPLQSLAPNIPGGLQFIIAKLLAKKPERRFQSGRHLAQALRRELNELELLKLEEPKRRYLPLQLRISLLMGAIIGTVLFTSIWLVLNRQYNAMRDMAVTSGAASVAFVAGNAGLTAAENAALPKGEEADWAPIEAFVGIAAENRNVAELKVMDSQNIIRGAKNTALIGQKYKPNPSETLIQQTTDLAVYEVRDKAGKQLFRFVQPIRYNQGTYGKVDMLVKQDRLENATRLSRILLMLLGAATLAAVMLTALIVTTMLARPIKRLNSAFMDAIKGNLDFRISHDSKNEFGEVFDSFNRFAGVMQDRLDSARSVALESSQLRFLPPIGSDAQWSKTEKADDKNSEKEPAS